MNTLGLLLAAKFNLGRSLGASGLLLLLQMGHNITKINTVTPHLLLSEVNERFFYSNRLYWVFIIKLSK